MSVKQSIKFNVRDEMLKDSKDLLDNVEVTTVAQECVKLKQKEDATIYSSSHQMRDLRPAQHRIPPCCGEN